MPEAQMASSCMLDLSPGPVQAVGSVQNHLLTQPDCHHGRPLACLHHAQYYLLNGPLGYKPCIAYPLKCNLNSLNMFGMVNMVRNHNVPAVVDLAE